jgi:hypothetical protein
MSGATGDAGAKSSGLEDGPFLRSGGVVGVVGRDDWGLGWRADGDTDGGGEDGAKDEGVGGEDAVVDDELDVGIGAQSGDGGGFVVGAGGGYDDTDADGCVVADDACAIDAGAGFGVRGDEVVAVGDKITVRDSDADGAGELLSARAQGGGESEGDENEDGEDDELAQCPDRTRVADSGVRCGGVG